MAVEAGGDARLGSSGPQLVAGDLFLDEAVVGLVGVEGLDDVVAIAPGVGARLVGLEAVGLGVAGEVEPVAAPALAVVRRGEQAVDELLEGVGRWSARKASTSSGVGGRPVRSKVARRRSVICRRAAAGSSPLASSFARMKASIGVRAQAVCCTEGGVCGFTRLERPELALPLRERFSRC